MCTAGDVVRLMHNIWRAHPGINAYVHFLLVNWIAVDTQLGIFTSNDRIARLSLIMRISLNQRRILLILANTIIGSAYALGYYCCHCLLLTQNCPAAVALMVLLVRCYTTRDHHMRLPVILVPLYAGTKLYWSKQLRHADV